MDNKKDRSSLFNHPSYIVYLVFLIGLIVNIYLAVRFFGNGKWLLGIWSLISILLLPKAALGLILILGRRGPYIYMPMIISILFSETLRKYRYDALPFFHYPIKELSKQLMWFFIGTFPILYFVFLR